MYTKSNVDSITKLKIQSMVKGAEIVNSLICMNHRMTRFPRMIQNFQHYI